MDNRRRGFLVLAILALLVAGLLTWALLNPSNVSGDYQYSIGALPSGPQSEGQGKATIKFKKTEVDTNG